MTDRLYRSRDDRMLAGVAGGVAEALDADPSLIRIVWALLILLTGGIALVVYIVMAIVVPERPLGMPAGPSAAGPWTPGTPTAPGAEGVAGPPGAGGPAGPVPEGGWLAPDGSTVPMGSAPAARHRHRRDPEDRARAGLVVGLIFILVGGYFLIRQFVPWVDPGFWWPTVAIALGILLIVLALMPSRRSG